MNFKYQVTVNRHFFQYFTFGDKSETHFYLKMD